jgi:hypothetical protein
MAAGTLVLSGISAPGLLDSPIQNWALLTFAVAMTLLLVAVAFLVPIRYRRPALIHSAFVAVFMVLVVGAFWR